MLGESKANITIIPRDSRNSLAVVECAKRILVFNGNRVLGWAFYQKVPNEDHPFNPY